jgi:hypothetical protein
MWRERERERGKERLVREVGEVGRVTLRSNNRWEWRYMRS